MHKRRERDVEAIRARKRESKKAKQLDRANQALAFQQDQDRLKRQMLIGLQPDTRNEQESGYAYCAVCRAICTGRLKIDGRPVCVKCKVKSDETIY